MKRERLGSAALMMMTFSAVFAFPSIINNSIQIGLATIPAYIFGSIFYFLPFILMIAEFASANAGKESGVYSWLECVLGPKWAFLGAWTYFFVNLFYFCSLLPQTLIYGSYAFAGRNVFEGESGTKIIAVISILLFWAATYVCVKGGRLDFQSYRICRKRPTVYGCDLCNSGFCSNLRFR